MTAWQVQLEGDVRDLEFLAKFLSAGQRRILRDAQRPLYLYESDSFHQCCTPEEVEQLAEEELAVLSGILKLERDARDCLRYGAIYRLNQNGGQDVFLTLRDSLQVRAEVGAVTAVAADAEGNLVTRPAPPPRSAVLLELGATDAAIAKVLRLLSAPDAMSWVGLYRIHEVIEGDSGGQHKLEKQGWGSADDLKRFKHSANSVQVGGDKSRHGKEPQLPPKNPMTLPEAEAYVRYIVQAWLVSKGA
ncbi:hypothetical protein R69658_07882 [Paraburkholderia aspalathi]|uniref:CYTH domain-containing protein n=1 Tax=Paraburkholderia aspalathi TaxID=1324617 RepID=A0ABM8T8F8_9BURK|nr:hypothetical protein [Paraburkholderia aspalathi]MBK3824142.1 hypothetical protein [Paraburkholderia aspalathi]MBK3835984.1 hypothetical protein [Paraburkholderia aspalathi]MBK3865754.1 hypothetical protein [Paraburkholderia aspalathi]CAE6866318.1 hypothetical protein R69658_07882 [Paraburkholderia aspalathi]